MDQLIAKRQAFRQKLKQGKTVFGGWTSLAHPSITEIFTKTGFDFIGIDIEHSTISQEQSQRIIAATQAGNSLCLPRIASHNMEMIKRLLDSGADGLIVPMVESADEVKSIIEWMKYAPQGKRSYGIARAQGYGFDFDSYTQSWNESSSLIVQIESQKAVENIESLLDFQEVDCAMIGPYDISGSLGIPGQIDHPDVKAAAQKVMDVCRKKGIACGTQVVVPDETSVKQAVDDGFQFIVLASDIFVLWKWAEAMRGIVNKN